MKVNLFNSKNPNGKRVAVTVNLEYPDVVQTNDGEVLYILALETGAVSTSGTRVPPVFVNNVTEGKIIEEIQNALSYLGQQIDWGTLEDDIYAPTILDISPINNQTNVPIDNSVFLRLKDMFPSSLVDTSTIKLRVNGIDVTSELQLKQKSDEVFITWVPIKIKE